MNTLLAQANRVDYLNKPYSESCDQNREPILHVIKPILAGATAVLEIGSGTGQHAVYFGEKLSHLQWYTSDLVEYHSGINAWLNDSKLDNVHPPVKLDVAQGEWPAIKIDAIISANTLHIMSWRHVLAFFAGVGRCLDVNGQCIVYGPFNYNNEYTSDSNRRFDGWLKARDPDSGIRNFEDVNTLAEEAGLKLINDYEMPVNNRILHWVKRD